jgi:hypothetical protein
LAADPRGRGEDDREGVLRPAAGGAPRGDGGRAWFGGFAGVGAADGDGWRNDFGPFELTGRIRRLLAGRSDTGQFFAYDIADGNRARDLGAGGL